MRSRRTASRYSSRDCELRSLGDLERQLQPRRVEERADGLALVDAADRLRKEGRHGEDLELPGARGRGTERHGIRGDELHDAALGETLRGVARQQRVRARDVDLVDAALLQDTDRVEDRRAREDLVVDDDRALLVDVPDDPNDLALSTVVAVCLLHEDERNAQRLGNAPSDVCVTEIRHDERDAVRILFDDRAERLDEEIARRKLVAGDREEALD